MLMPLLLRPELLPQLVHTLSLRSEMLKTRRELRDVRLALRRDIDRLDGWLKFANIALLPIVIGVGVVGWSLWRSRRRNGKDRTGHSGVRS